MRSLIENPIEPTDTLIVIGRKVPHCVRVVRQAVVSVRHAKTQPLRDAFPPTSEFQWGSNRNSAISELDAGFLQRTKEAPKNVLTPPKQVDRRQARIGHGDLVPKPARPTPLLFRRLAKKPLDDVCTRLRVRPHSKRQRQTFRALPGEPIALKRSQLLCIGKVRGPHALALPLKALLDRGPLFLPRCSPGVVTGFKIPHSCLPPLRFRCFVRCLFY